jgi:two-component system nitrogen regulation response regulator NtrX
MRILIVDDEEQIRELVVELLRDEGYVVDTAASVAEGLAKLQQAAPDVLLVDAWLGDGDGRTLIAHCRSDECLANLSIVILTAAVWNDADNDLAVTAVVSKPFEIDALLTAVKSAATVTGTPEACVLQQ